LQFFQVEGIIEKPFGLPEDGPDDIVLLRGPLGPFHNSFDLEFDLHKVFEVRANLVTCHLVT